jgi:FAD/FMN-containing dehydrogenase
MAPESFDVAREELAELVRRAEREGLRISIAGARHSMGGHTIYPDGVVLDMTPFNHMTLDEITGVLRVGAGARWKEVIPYLNRFGRSVIVMQSNDSFSVGGSVSVNCHGWQSGHPPIAATVRSLTLLRANGEVVQCNREKNAELFSLALGGYGLFGVILEVELDTALNQEYTVKRTIVSVHDYVNTYRAQVDSQSNVGMVFGRLSVAPDSFLDTGILTVFTETPDSAGQSCELTGSGIATLKRAIFRGSADNDYGKSLRWSLESRIGEFAFRKTVWRNQLLNDGVETLENRSSETTDILHEYFVPPEEFATFLSQVARITRDHDGDLLNVTVREVHEDTDTYLRYADKELFAFVMLFIQANSNDGDARMEAMTRDLIELAIGLGGHYYLPYRLHATPEQFARSYPRGNAFFERKRSYDRNEVFQNMFYLKYGKSTELEGVAAVLK